MRDRFDIDLLDPVDPFEIDDENRPHLYKHLPYVSGRHVAVGVEEILDVYLLGDPMYEPGREDGKADWVMIGETPRNYPQNTPGAAEPARSNEMSAYWSVSCKRWRAEALPRMGEEAMTNSNPEKSAPVGPRARAGQARLLTSHVPIRFRPQTIERAKLIAERDGMTVSSWIRTVVEREVERRMPASPHTRLSESGTSWRVVHYDNPAPEVETKNPEYDPRHAQLESV